MKTKTVQAIIETPKGSNHKYKYETSYQRFILDKILPVGFVFPYDFGFIPDTIAEDGDPLDILVINKEATFTGCIIQCRVLGAIEAKQTQKNKSVRNDRIVVVPEKALDYSNISKLKDLGDDLIKELNHFFISYHKFDEVEYEPLKVVGPDKAFKLIEKACNGGN
jgi:inorganic pyrophosphatase